jgi:5-formyltetrahydrofolate cyclo-ligase
VSSKHELRRELKSRLAALPRPVFAEAGARAAAILTQLPLWGECKTLLLFLSMKDEIDSAPLLEAAFRAGKKVFVPRLEGKDLVFYRINSPAGPWQEGPFGIREPADLPARTGGSILRGSAVPGGSGPPSVPPPSLVPADFPALLIVPGLGFDPRGNRLGRGKGYYDRFLTALDRRGLPFTAIGLCMEAQLLPELSTESWDRKMDGICTEARQFPRPLYL